MVNRVWFDARSLSRRYTTGWERYVRELANHLPKLIDTTIWTPNTYNRLALLMSDFQTTKSQSGHQVVHFPTYPPRNKNKDTSQVITVHDLTWWKYPETSSFLGKNYYKNNMSQAILQSDLIICPSNAIRTEIHNKFSIPTNKISSIPHGNSLPKGVVSPYTKPYFLSIGTIEPRKNLDFYAQAIKESKLQSNFDFFHVGRKGWANLPSNLKSIDVKNDQELANLIINAQAVVIPSLYEGFGLPVLESHAQGTPVVISNDPALVELSTSSDKIFELGNLDSLALALKYFSETKQKLDSSQITESQSMTWANSAQKHVEAYLGLLR
jgi:glycosyltransferase involved in cell wall biosynthesis